LHVREALKLTEELLGPADLPEDHRRQIQEAVPADLLEAIDYLGPYEPALLDVP
jgi:hypothetical protein